MVDPTVLKSVALCVWVRVPPGVQSADVAKLVDALDLGSSPLWGGGSIPPIRTKMDSKKPQKEILEEKYKIFKTYAALSKIYGVSTKTIKKWLLSYDIKL